MAGESVALNPALRERNRNLKGCGLTGLLFFGLASPLQPLGPKTPDSPRAGVCAGASSEGGKGFSVNAVRRILPDRAAATDSHALSNTWESVQKFGLPGNGVVI